MATTRRCTRGLIGMFISLLMMMMALGDACPYYQGCTTNDDCTSITCSSQFVQKDITTTMKLNTCRDPISLTVKLDVAELRISWSYTFTKVEDIAVPGFSYGRFGGIYIRAEIKRGDDKVVKISVKLIAKLLGREVASITIAEGDLGTVRASLSDCGPIAWLKDQETGIQIAVAAAMFVCLALITCCFCCCCCCCRSCRTQSGPAHIVTVPAMPVSMDQVGSVPVKYERFDV